MTTPVPTDRRVARTRRDLLAAFDALILERGYDRLTVRDVIARANVGRSTFYEHFENKDDLFRHSVRPVFACLAETIGSHLPSPGLAALMDHIDRHRRVTRTMLRNAAGPVLTAFLAELVQERLSGREAGTLPAALAAACIAGAQIALLQAWLAAPQPCSSATLAHAVHAATNAAVDALAPPASRP